LEIVGESIDEVLFQAYEAIISKGAPNTGSRGASKEILGVTLRIAHPRARISRSEDRGRPSSALGELLWYLSGTDDISFITAYIKSYQDEVGATGTINGAYGPRLFSRYGLDQLEEVKLLLERKKGSRRAVVQIYSALDLTVDDEVPCTTTLQFFIRDDLLHLAASLRSNDAYLGLPHDVFCFTMIQELMARRLGLDVGEYIQMIGSFHVYDKDLDRVSRYLSEGHHRLAEMPAMPIGDPFVLLPHILDLERRMRIGECVDDEVSTLDPYWADLMRLLQSHFASNNEHQLDIISTGFQEPIFRTYLDDRRERSLRSSAKHTSAKS